MSPRSPTKNQQKSPGGWSRLPAEIRLKIYQDVWETRTVFFGIRKPGTIAHPPITLAINCESRQETLKHYHRYDMSISRKIKGLSGNPDQWIIMHKYGYVNPHLDTLCLTSLAGELFRTKLKALRFPTIHEPVLHFAIDDTAGSRGPDIYPRLMFLNGLEHLILTLDFWASVVHPAGGAASNYRYRVCWTRGPAALKTLARYETAVFRPDAGQDFNQKVTSAARFYCSKDNCEKREVCSTWKYVPDASRTLTCDQRGLIQQPDSLPMADQSADPERSRELRMVSAIASSHELEAHGRQSLKRDEVLLFNSCPAAALRSARNVGRRRVGWIVLKVVSPDDVWPQELAGRAFEHLEWYGCSHMYSRQAGKGYNHSRKFSWTMNRILSLMLEVEDAIRYVNKRPEVTVGSSPRAVRKRDGLVDGVCGPRYLCPGQGRLRVPHPEEPGLDDDCYPEVSDPSFSERALRGKTEELPYQVRFLSQDHWEAVSKVYHSCDKGSADA
ncbi:hypothetical protein QBC40DRAFT_269401 [Triangularia verruculosa]|uniref:2EXR domain-containing protein n=1 Tax=Triangularia verruculosa TaxID=2587418 RepID=A0AAN6X955_9PEZI|nr:hypothetical protein QBC40DRAFT_269401 [Triangularia verruculosa]